MAPPGPKRDGEHGAQRGAGPESGNTAKSSLPPFSRSLKHTAHTPDRCQEKGSMTCQEPVGHKDKCLNPKAKCSRPQDQNFGVHGIPVPPNQDGSLIMPGTPCNAGYTVGTQFMPQQVLLYMLGFLPHPVSSDRLCTSWAFSS